MKPQVMSHPVIILIQMMKIYPNHKANRSIQFPIRIVGFKKTIRKLREYSSQVDRGIIENSTEIKTYDFQEYLTLYLAPRYCQTRYSYLLSHPKLQAECKCLQIKRIIFGEYLWFP